MAAAPPTSASPAAPDRRPSTARARAIWLGVLCFAVYVANVRLMGANDTIPARLIPFSIVREGNLDLDEFQWLRARGSVPYFLRQGIDGHWYSRYPITTSVLLTPLYAPVTWWLQYHHIDDDDVRFRLAAVLMEHVGAAAVSAASVSLVFLALCTLVPGGTALAVALVYAFGTSTWAISSQALWQHAGTQLGVAGLSLALLRPPTWRTLVAAGAAAAFTVAARPTGAVFGILAFVYVARHQRSRLPAFCVLPALVGAVLLSYNFHLTGGVAGGYAPQGFHAPALDHLLGLLVSPNRGLLVFTPAVLFAAPAIARLHRLQPRWLGYLGVSILAYLLLYSSFTFWWAGSCYGPRFFSDVLPAFALLAAATVERLRSSTASVVLVITLALWGVCLQGIGVYCDDTSWNWWPKEVINVRAWDWRDLHVVRAVRSGWHGADLIPLVWQAIADPRPARLHPLPPEDLAGRISVRAALPIHFPARPTGTLDVEIANHGRATWPAFSEFAYQSCVLLHRWWAAGSMIPNVGGPRPLSRNLGPGETLRLRVRLDLPAAPGSYELELLVAQEYSVNSGAGGGASVRIPVQIGAPRE